MREKTTFIKIALLLIVLILLGILVQKQISAMYQKKIEAITYLVRNRSFHNNVLEQMILVSHDKNGEYLYVAKKLDINDKERKIFTIDTSSNLEFHPPFYSYDEYIVAPLTKKGDHHDIDLLIATFDGKVITDSVKEFNSIAGEKEFIFKGEAFDRNNYIFKLHLKNNNGAQETVLINLTTGKIIDEYSVDEDSTEAHVHE